MIFVFVTHDQLVWSTFVCLLSSVSKTARSLPSDLDSMDSRTHGDPGSTGRGHMAGAARAARAAELSYPITNSGG